MAMPIAGLALSFGAMLLTSDFNRLSFLLAQSPSAQVAVGAAVVTALATSAAFARPVRRALLPASIMLVALAIPFVVTCIAILSRAAEFRAFARQFAFEDTSEGLISAVYDVNSLRALGSALAFGAALGAMACVLLVDRGARFEGSRPRGLRGAAILLALGAALAALSLADACVVCSALREAHDTELPRWELDRFLRGLYAAAQRSDAFGRAHEVLALVAFASGIASLARASMRPSRHIFVLASAWLFCTTLGFGDRATTRAAAESLRLREAWGDDGAFLPITMLSREQPYLEPICVAHLDGLRCGTRAPTAYREELLVRVLPRPYRAGCVNGLPIALDARLSARALHSLFVAAGRKGYDELEVRGIALPSGTARDVSHSWLDVMLPIRTSQHVFFTSPACPDTNIAVGTQLFEDDTAQSVLSRFGRLQIREVPQRIEIDL